VAEAGVGQRIDVDVDLEAVDLTPEPVAPHRDVHRPQAVLVVPAVEDLRAEQDRSGAGPEDRSPGPAEVAQRFEQVEALGQHRHGGGLAAGQDEAVDGVELVGPAHLYGADPERLEEVDVQAERPLKGEDPDGHQPRSANVISIWSMPMPVMGA